MSYAVRNDKQGWRSVSGFDDVGPDEWYSIDAPPDPVPLPLTAEELVAATGKKRDQLLAAAANRMGPLQDAVDIGLATHEEVTRLVLWKSYRVDLNRIEQQEGFPTDTLWPLSPDEVPPETPSK